MPEVAGYEEYLFIGAETTFGTAASTMLYLPVEDYGVRAQTSDITLEEHLGQPDVIDDSPDKIVVSGPVKGNAYGIGSVILETIWDWAFTRTSGQIKSLTGEWGGAIDPVRHLGLRFQDFSLEAAADSPVVKWSGTLVGRDEIVLVSASAVPDPSPYSDSTTRAGGPMVFQQGASLFTIDAAVTKLAGFKLKIENHLDSWFTGDLSVGYPKYQMIAQSRPGRRTISGELTLVPTTNAFETKVRARQRWATEIGMQGYKGVATDRRGVLKVTSTLPRGFNPQKSLDKAGRLVVPFGARKSGSTAIVTATWSDVTGT